MNYDREHINRNINNLGDGVRGLEGRLERLTEDMLDILQANDHFSALTDKGFQHIHDLSEIKKIIAILKMSHCMLFNYYFIVHILKIASYSSGNLFNVCIGYLRKAVRVSPGTKSLIREWLDADNLPESGKSEIMHKLGLP